MTFLWVFIVAVVLVVALCVLVAWLTDDKGQRASGDHSFRAAKTPSLALPSLALPSMQPGSYLPPYFYTEPDKLDRLAAAFADRLLILPEPVLEATRVITGSGSPAPNLAQHNWTEKDIRQALPAWVIDALGGHNTVDSCVRSIFDTEAVPA